MSEMARAPPEVDPLLKDLNEKKQSFHRNVVSLAAELKEARSRLASQERLFAKETVNRQEAEAKAKDMEEEIIKLEKSLEERSLQLQASTSVSQMYVHKLDDLRRQLSAARATIEASAVSAESAQRQCSTLLQELEEKNWSLKDHEARVTELGQQLDHLQKDLQSREFSQMQLRDEVARIEHEIMQSVTKTGTDIDSHLGRIFNEVSPKNLENLNKHLCMKDEEIGKLRNEIRVMSAHWELKTKELESRLEKHRRADQELKKKVLKLEFCLQEARAQTRKLQRIGERRDKAMKELKDKLAAKKHRDRPQESREKSNFWDKSGFKIAITMSMLIMVMFSKR